MLDADASKWRDNSAEHGNRARANVCFCCCLPCVTHLPVQFSAKGNDHSLGLFLLMFLLGPSCRDSSSRAGFSMYHSPGFNPSLQADQTHECVQATHFPSGRLARYALMQKVVC